MTRVRCPLCGEWIQQRERIVRVVVELVEKDKGDSSDPEEWSRVIDWSLVAGFLSHAECSKMELETREGLIPIPCEDDLRCLLDEEPEDDPRVDLRVVR